MKAMIFQRSSEVLTAKPIFGIPACMVPYWMRSKPRFFQVRGAQRHEPEQHIVSVTPEPDALSQGRAEAAAAGAAMTFVAARQPEIFDELVLLRELA